MTTANLGMPELVQNQTGADITHNSALAILDSTVQLVVINMTTTASPTGAEGVRYIPATGASGAWDSTWENKVAAYSGGAWVKIIPQSGWTLFDLDTQKYYSYNGTIWSLTQMEPEVLDTEFRVVKSTDSTSKMDFDMSKVETATTTTFIMPNGDVEFAKTKLDAIAAPTVNDDITLFYEPGSVWVDTTNNKGYLCVDNTDGAAIWREMAAASGTGDVSSSVSSSTDNTIVRMDGAGGKTVNSSTVILDDNDAIYGNYSKIDEKTAAYTLAAADSGKIIIVTSGTFNITLPQTSTAAITVGFACTVINRGTGVVTFVKEGSDTIESKSSFVDLSQYGAASVVKVAGTSPNTWGLYGDLE